jgi:hypothetical protein
MRVKPPQQTRIHVSLSLNTIESFFDLAKYRLLLVFVGLCSFVFAQPTAFQPRDPSFVSKKEDKRC